MLPHFFQAMICAACVVTSSVTYCNEEYTAEHRAADIAKKGAAALVTLQGADGGWHSQTYGVLKPGAALTAHTLSVFTMLPEARDTHKASIAKAFAFLDKATGADGGVGTTDEWHDYPAYATAYTVIALVTSRPPGWEARVEKHTAWLLAAQNTASAGCPASHPAHGGWNPQGPVKGLPPHADLSTTSAVAQALILTESSLPKNVERRTQLRNAFNSIELFRSRCQNYVDNEKPDDVNDGGFVFTATRTELNKADAPDGKDGPSRSVTGFTSYGAATADGLALLQSQHTFFVLDNPDQDAAKNRFQQSITACERWLERNVSLKNVAGFADPKNPRAQAMQFYCRSAMTEAVSALHPGISEGLQVGWVYQAARLQQKNGLFINPNNGMKEDDPLIATPLAIRALLPILKR